MAGAALVNARRGAKGGYSLDRRAAEVTVTEIIQALEGPIALTACVDGAEDSCEVERCCPMRGNWNRVNRAIQAALDDVTLADMLDRSEEHTSALQSLMRITYVVICSNKTTTH